VTRPPGWNAAVAAIRSPKDRRGAHASVPSHAVTGGAYAAFEVGASRDVIKHGADGFSQVRVIECRKIVPGHEFGAQAGILKNLDH